MTATQDELRTLLTAALSEVALAQAGLATTLRELGSGGARAEKVAISTVVSDAFSRLRRANEELERLRDLLEVDADAPKA